MAHFQIEYSANLESAINMAALCETVRASAASLNTFATAGIRVRATRVDHYAIADGDAHHGFIDISIRLRGGRSDEEKAQAASTIFAAAEAHVAGYMAAHSLALSLEVRDIDPSLSPKIGSVRAHMEDAHVNA